jgi:DNA-binding Lrp family transcriptional regulator
MQSRRCLRDASLCADQRAAGQGPRRGGAVSQMPGVRHADACWGLPDIFAYVETPDEKTLNLLVTDKIQRMDGVERTETHIVVE